VPRQPRAADVARMRKAFFTWTALISIVAALAISAAGCASGRSAPSATFGIVASADPAVIERGRYLVLGPGHCAACHGDPAQEARRRAGEAVPLSGGRVFDLGAAGSIVAPNITNDPVRGIGALSDDVVVRSMRYGVSRGGRTMAPFMSLADVSDEDLRAILSYLRAQPPVAGPVPARRLNWLGSLGLQLMLDPQTPALEPPIRTPPPRTAEYGRYLAHTVANCAGCHTRRSRLTGEFIGPPLAGGMELKEPHGTFATPNLTPVRAGVLDCSEAEFIARFRVAGRGEAGSPMPWESYARMTDDDLGAIYRYLRTLPPATSARR
jgi:mono/diheme cytochrome c family protein